MSNQFHKERDRELEEMFRAHAAWLRATVERRFGREVAEDLVQETYLRVLARVVPDGIRSPRPFLMRIASNLMADLHRRGARATETIEDGWSVQATPSSQVEAVVLREIVLGLPQPLRDVFVLSRFGGLTNIQIAGKLGISAKTVEWRMTKALAHCAAQLRR